MAFIIRNNTGSSSNTVTTASIPMFNAAKIQDLPLNPVKDELDFGYGLMYDGTYWNYFRDILFILSENRIIDYKQEYLTFESYGKFTKDFNVFDEYYLYSGDPHKFSVDIQFIYNWVNSSLPYKFRFELYIQRANKVDKELIFNCFVGLEDFPGITGLFSKSVIIDLSNGDKIFVNIIKNLENTLLQIHKNSNIKIRYLV